MLHLKKILHCSAMALADDEDLESSVDKIVLLRKTGGSLCVVLVLISPKVGTLKLIVKHKPCSYLRKASKSGINSVVEC